MAKVWRSFHIEAPKELETIYKKLQEAENLILNNNELCQELMAIDYSFVRGKVWMVMNNKFSASIDKVVKGIPNAAWYKRILYENLRRLATSTKEKQKAFDILKENEFKINSQLWSKLNEEKLYCTRGYIENLKDSGVRPVLPRESVFVLDFSISDSQMFVKEYLDDGRVLVKIKYSTADWLEWYIEKPMSIRENATGKIANPRFYYKNGDFVGDISYEIEAEKLRKFNNILGVDLGLVNIYSASVLYKNGSTSREYLPSNKLRKMCLKQDLIKAEISSILDKNTRVEPYLKSKKALKTTQGKLDRRLNNLNGNSQKLMNLKNENAKLAAFEIVEIARQEKCCEIHIENLSWLKSKGGKWNHSIIQKYIQEFAEIYGIKVVKINPAYSSSMHPITGEKGIDKDRDIVFKNREKIDRDKLAGINLASRSKKKEDEIKVKKINKRKSKRFKNLLKHRVGNALTVAASAVVPDNKTKNADINGCYEHCSHSNSKTTFAFRSKSNSLLTRGHIFHKRSTRGQKNYHNL